MQILNPTAEAMDISFRPLHDEKGCVNLIATAALDRHHVARIGHAGRLPPFSGD
jgi:hypothetical protein